MTGKTGFDNNRYLARQTEAILERVERFHNKLYLELGVKPEDRPVVTAARQGADEARSAGKGNNGIFCAAAIELGDGGIITGKNSPLMHAASSLILNTIKHLAEVLDRLHLLSPAIIDSVGNLKQHILGAKSVSLDVEEVMISLSINASANPTAELALEKLSELRGREVHLTHIPTPGDEAGLRRLGVNLTSDPNFSSKILFVN